MINFFPWLKELYFVNNRSITEFVWYILNNIIKLLKFDSNTTKLDNLLIFIIKTIANPKIFQVL